MITHRNDIQALRAFAVLIVLFYHAEMSWLPGGYLGVDVFFVISGYLITGLIQRAIERGDFSFREFYFRRAKRLLPACLAVVFACILLAPFFLTSLELKDFREQAMGAVTFTANFVLWEQTGYFEATGDLKPLLHTWSLAVEEQYYILLPALLFFTPKRYWLTATVVILLASLALFAFMHDSSAAFYLLPMRLWELAIGSAGALIVDSRVSSRIFKAAFWPCLLLLLVLPATPYVREHPVWAALLICIATLVVLKREHPLSDCAPVRRFGRIGDISYSLYLVHWPLFAFMNNSWVGMTPQPLSARLGLLLLSFFLAWLLYRFIENPIRRSKIEFSLQSSLSFGAASCFLLLISGFALGGTDSGKDYEYVRRTNFGFGRPCEYTADFKPKAECRNSTDPEILVWGDSIAMHLVPGLSANATVIQATMSACGPLLDVAMLKGIRTPSWAENCISFNDSIISFLKQAPSVKTVVLSSLFTQYINPRDQLVRRGDKGEFSVIAAGVDEGIAGMRRTVDAIRAASKAVVVIAPMPSGSFDTGRCLERLERGLPTFGATPECRTERRSKGGLQDLLTGMTTQADVAVIDPSDFLCGASSCKSYVDGTLLYRDRIHLSHDGSLLLAKGMNLVDEIGRAAR